MPKQRFGIALIALAAITASLGLVVVTVVCAVLGAFLVDEG